MMPQEFFSDSLNFWIQGTGAPGQQIPAAKRNHSSPSDGLYRSYVVQGNYVAVLKEPCDSGETIVYQTPGASILTTGRSHGSFIEVHNAHLQTGWMPLASLEPSPDGGRHGDHLEESGGIQALLQAHQDASL